MKALTICILCCLSVSAADMDEIHVTTRTNTKISPGYVVTYEEFTRRGETNLLRVTTYKDGVTNSIAHNFYHDGAYLGRYSQAAGLTFVNSAPNAPFALNFVWDSSNQVKIATVRTTNRIILDSFTCTNGLFYPVSTSKLEESNTRLKGILNR